MYRGCVETPEHNDNFCQSLRAIMMSQYRKYTGSWYISRLKYAVEVILQNLAQENKNSNHAVCMLAKIKLNVKLHRFRLTLIVRDKQ